MAKKLSEAALKLRAKGFHRAGENWTSEELSIVRAGFEADKTTKEVSTDLGGSRSPETIWRRWELLGLVNAPVFWWQKNSEGKP